jgi:hypothetical protein
LVRRGVLTSKQAEELKQHYRIKLLPGDYIDLFFRRFFRCCYKNSLYNTLESREEYLMKLYDLAEKKISSELNIVKLVNHYRHVRALLLED